MLISYNKHEKYFNECVYYFLMFFNHHCKEINSIIYSNFIYTYIDIYIRSIIKNSYYNKSKDLYEDVKEMVEYFNDTNRIISIIHSYDGNYYDAYHHLAIDIQMKRISNRFKLKTKQVISIEFFNLYNLNTAICYLYQYI